MDDLFVLYNKPGLALRDAIFKQFQKYVEIDNLGPVSWALKTLIQRDHDKGIVKISQEQFCKDFLNGSNFGTPAPIPAVVTGADVNMTPDDVLDDEIRTYPFQSDIGSMWWLANISRPDIFFAVHRVLCGRTNLLANFGAGCNKSSLTWLALLTWVSCINGLLPLHLNSVDSWMELLQARMKSSPELGGFSCSMATSCPGPLKTRSAFSPPQPK